MGDGAVEHGFAVGTVAVVDLEGLGGVSGGARSGDSAQIVPHGRVGLPSDETLFPPRRGRVGVVVDAGGHGDQVARVVVAEIAGAEVDGPVTTVE